MTTPTRRGRPPGSRNKPKPGLTKNLEVPDFEPPPPTPMPSTDIPTTTADTVSTTTHSDAITIPPDTNWTTGFEATERDGPYVLRRKQGMGKGSEETPLDWPEAWPLPKKGSTLRVDGNRLSVTSVEYNLDDGKIVVVVE